MPTATTPPDPSGEFPLEERPWWSIAAAAAGGWIALVHATLWWLDHRPSPRTLWGDENTYLQSATQFLAGDPRWWPEPLWPPLFPQFLGGLLWLGDGGLIRVVLAQTLLLAVTAAVLGDLTRHLTGSRSAGLAAAILTLGYPPLAAFSHYLWPEILHLFLFAAMLWILVVRGDSKSWCAVAGVVLGLALLCKSLVLPFVPVLVVATFWGSRPRDAVLKAALLLGLTAVTVAPTILANARRTGTPMIANSATFNLWVGLNDVGRESFEHDVVWPEYQRWTASAESYVARDRILRTQIRTLVRERGLFAVIRDQLAKQYFRLFDAGCYLTDQLPGGPAQERAGAGYLGVGATLGRTVTAATVVSILFLYATAPVGLIIGRCRNRRWVRVLAVFLLYNLLILALLHVKTRYRVQMLPAAFVGLGCLVTWFEAGCRPRPSVARVTGALATVGILFWFALG